MRKLDRKNIPMWLLLIAAPFLSFPMACPEERTVLPAMHKQVQSPMWSQSLNLFLPAEFIYLFSRRNRFFPNKSQDTLE